MIVENNLNTLNNLNNVNNITFESDLLTRKADTTKNGNFEQFYDAALGVFNNTNTFEHQAEQAQLDFATGKNDNLLSVMMAQEKAHSSLNFTVQVTNKIIEAYREIMRIQL